MLALLPILALSATVALAGSPAEYTAPFTQCSQPSSWLPLSCSAGAANSTVNGCCALNTGGLVLSTQFWNTDAGYDDLWTIHGTWNDNCNGTYDAFCRATPTYTNVTEILKSYGRGDLLAQMRAFWISNNMSPLSLWLHEFRKHASCMSTFNNECYGPGYRYGQELVDYFDRTVKLFLRLDTYAYLANSNIYPSNSTNVTYSALQTAFVKSFGQEVTLECTKAGELSGIYYNFWQMGNVQNGISVPAPPPTNFTSCPRGANAIRYPTKQVGYVTSPYAKNTTIIEFA